MVNPAANGTPVAPGNVPAPGYILKLIWLFVLFMFTVLIMYTSTCHVITFSLIYTMNYLLNYGIKIYQILPKFLTGPVIVTDEEVLRLDVTLDDALLVHRLGARQQLPHDDAHRGLREGQVAATPLVVEWEFVDALPVDTLHGEAELRGGWVTHDAA
jgi:hypothetical protein